MESPLVTVSASAAWEIRRLREVNAVDGQFALRVDVIGGAPSGFAYDLCFDAPRPDDLHCEGGGVHVIVRPAAAAHLRGTVVRWAEGDNGAGFLIDNPNEPPT